MTGINETVDNTLRAFVQEALEGLPFGLTENDTRDAFDHLLGWNPHVTADPAHGLLLPDFLEWRDTVLLCLIREGEILQRVIGGQVRLVLARFAAAKDRDDR